MQMKKTQKIMEKNNLDNAFQSNSKGRSEENYTYLKPINDNLLDDLWNTENKIKVDGHWYIRMSNAISISYKYNTKNKKDK